jgi:primosomal protein N' (replication factor Y) (superfamily II helicase)
MIYHVAVPLPLWQWFSFTWHEPLSEGQMVCVPWRQKTLLGWVIASDAEPSSHCKAIQSIVPFCVPPLLLACCRYISRYYGNPLGMVLSATFPFSAVPRTYPSHAQTLTLLPRGLAWTLSQQQCIQQLTTAEKKFHVWVLDGLTGSGKTEVYLAWLAQQAGQVLWLLPEIGLVHYFSERLQTHVKPIAVYHSQMTPAKRAAVWQSVAAGHTPLVIGTRSALLLPFKNLFGIIVDEAHDPSFRQEQLFRYHATDMAVYRAYLENIPIILGSATHRIDTLHHKSRFTWLHLNERPMACVPTIQCVSIQRQALLGGLSGTALQHIKLCLSHKQHVLIFLNQRGFAPALCCQHCGELSMCQACDKQLTYHKALNCLWCHHCGYQNTPSWDCTHCNARSMKTIGMGTEQVTEALATLFPDVTLVRLDRDTVPRGKQLIQALAHLPEDQGALLIGTQLLAKGYDIPRLQLAIIVDSDGQWFSGDFRAPARLAQLVTQVAGRVGRHTTPGLVLVQTRKPDHTLLKILLEKGYSAYAQAELALRQKHYLPPFRHMCWLKAATKIPEKGIENLEILKNYSLKLDATLRITGPMPSLMPKKANVYYSELWLDTHQRSRLQDVIDGLVTHPLLAKHHGVWIERDPS